uniref:Prefoldin subunit 5 n=1 Tax=Trichuris muris TaxID=70415 RepID=A0A5S6QIQ1_TRIMR
MPDDRGRHQLVYATGRNKRAAADACSDRQLANLVGIAISKSSNTAAKVYIISMENSSGTSVRGSSGSAEGRNVVNLESLSVVQMTLLQKQLDMELGFMTDSLMQLKIAGSRLRSSGDALAQMVKESKPGQSGLIPLSSAMFVWGSLTDHNKFLIDVGADFLVEMESDNAIDYFNRKVKFVDEQIAQVQSVIDSKRRVKSEVTDLLVDRISKINL